MKNFSLLFIVVVLFSCEPIGRFTDEDFNYEYKCTPVKNIQATEDGNDVVLTWLVTGIGQILFEVEYGILGFELGTGTVVSTREMTTTLTGLDDNRNYEFNIRTSCSDGEMSIWVKSIYTTN